MILFALALHVLVKDIEALFRPLFHAWYADDGTIICPRDHAPSLMTTLITKGRPLGFAVSMSKTECLWPSAPPTLLGLPCAILPMDTLSILGSPIGTSAKQKAFSRVQTSVDRLQAGILTLSHAGLANSCSASVQACAK